jgi:hypothetical protein
MRSRADYEQQRHMKKHGIDLKDNFLGDGSRTKRLDLKDCVDALMGEGVAGAASSRRTDRGKVRIVPAKSSHCGRLLAYCTRCRHNHVVAD